MSGSMAPIEYVVQWKWGKYWEDFPSVVAHSREEAVQLALHAVESDSDKIVSFRAVPRDQFLPMKVHLDEGVVIVVEYE